MAPNSRPTSVLDSLGEEIIRIVTPVSICMFLVVILVSVLDSSSSSPSSVSSMATIAYSETDSDSSWDKFLGALWNSLAFVAVVTVVTFVLVLLFYLRCTRFLKFYMAFSAFIVLGFLGGEIALFLIQDFSIPVDCVTFFVVLFNFAVVGVLAVFMSKMAIFVTQGYLVIIGMLVAYWFTMLPEWTTWVMLVAMALYDLAAVLLPVGPLRLLVELAISRDEDIPALVYEARPVTHSDSGHDGGVVQRRVWRERHNSAHDPAEVPITNSTVNPGLHGNSNNDSASNANGTSIANENTSPGSLSVNSVHNVTNSVAARERLSQDSEDKSELSVPLIDHRINVGSQGHEDAIPSENLALEGVGLGSSGAIKLGLGDFIFYSVLVGRAAMYDFMTVYACYLAIIAGLVLH
ncbi:hypothetical protein BT93_B0336 [Corymbia citriodora subsp. variegata]|nr:hypothetical protein BT93_B0336 [Corymbia citriodora subsp. variegata]